MKLQDIKVLVVQWWSILHDPRDCSLPGSAIHGILQARILEWVSHSFLQGIFPTQGLKLGLLHCRQILYCLSHQGSLDIMFNEKSQTQKDKECMFPLT